MCIAIYKPAGKVIDRDTLHRCYLKNKDGCGFAYFKTDGELVIMKSMNFDSFYEDYEFHSVVNADRPFLVHFRIATHGTVDIYNCHPFQIDENHVMIHNGIIHNIRKCPDKKRSDTQMFVDDILKELPREWMFNWGITNLIEDYIGGSKVVVLAANDSVTIYNESKGEWADDIWYSNSGYKEVVSRYYYSQDRDDRDYYGSRYGSSTPYNYERPNIVDREEVGKLYGRWEFDNTLQRTKWIEVPRAVNASTPGAVWAWDAKIGAMNWVVCTNDAEVLPKEEKKDGWKYNKSTGMMEEYVGGIFTGACYIASKRNKKKHLALVEYKQKLLPPPPEREYETCCSCCQVMQTDELFVVDEFKEADDCFVCARCIDEFNASGTTMSNPVKLSDIKLIEKEIQNIC